jgi:hypothetical protein
MANRQLSRSLEIKETLRCATSLNRQSTTISVSIDNRFPPAGTRCWIMKLHRGCQVLLLGAALLSSAAGLGQAVPAHPELAAPSATIESGSAVMDTSYCPAISADDPRLGLVSKLCEFALIDLQQLPDFIAQQTTTAREGSSENVITAQVTFRQGQEHYSHVTINGRAVPSSSLTLTPPKNLPLSSTGEFGSVLVDLFASPAAAEFKFRKRATLRGIPVAVYEFHLPSAKNTFWMVRGTDGRVLTPEFRGQLWLEQETGRPLREELEPVSLPASSGVASLKTVTDYTMTSVGEVGAFLLPVRSESTLCFSKSRVPCTTNVLVFHDYRKFAATTRIVDASPEP